MSKIKILAVDDELHIRRLLEQKLKSAGFEVKTANSGEQGIEAASSFRPDLIVSDYRMPGKLNGLEMIDALRNEDCGRDIPAILLTGSVAITSSLCKKIVDMANITHVSKPFSPRKLISLIQETVEGIGPKT